MTEVEPLRGHRRPRFERRLLLLTLAAGAPGIVVALVLLWLGDDHDRGTQWLITGGLLVAWLGLSVAVRRFVVYPLQVLANLLEALREGDYSLRARRAGRGDALAEVLHETNALAETLKRQRLGAVEATALLHRVMTEIDVAIFAFDEASRLRLVNRAGERLLAAAAPELLGRTAPDLALDDFLTGDPARTFERRFPGASGRWGMRRSGFREEGRPHQLLVVADLSRPLRQEERQAWKRLIRVLGHELNNSLTPIKSLTATLRQLLQRRPRAEDWEADAESALALISERAESLARFLGGYSRLARLPPPQLETVDLAPLVRRVVALETRLAVQVEPGDEQAVRADPDQLEQLLINLVRNGADAALETGGGVTVGWSTGGRQLDLWVADEGPGLAGTANLFVPFFTTKPHGTGIGLVLCRDIAEAHGGTLTLENRADGPGCEAHLRMPVG